MSAAVHINVAFVTFKTSRGWFYRLLMEVSGIDCGCKRAGVCSKRAFLYGWHLMKWSFVCVHVCTRVCVCLAKYLIKPEPRSSDAGGPWRQFEISVSGSSTL